MMSAPSRGRPSFSQLMVGGGTPTAEHSSLSGVFTGMVISSGELEREIFGGSGSERGMFYYIVYLILQHDLNLE